MALTRIKAQQISDIDYKQAVRVIALSNITLAGSAPNLVDGVNLAANDRILVSGQDIGSQNGLYYVQTLGTGSNGTWVRTSDGNETGEIQSGMIVMVTEGDAYKDTQWKLTTNDPIVIGSSNLVFEQNSAFAFGNIYASGTAVLATAVGGVVSFVAGNNIAITGNNTAKSIQFDVTGISLNSISNGTSNVNVISSGGNVTIGIDGTNDIAVFATTGGYIAGVMSASGNVIGSNIETVGEISAAGNIFGSNLSISADAVISGNLTINGNVTYINSNVVTTNDKSIVLANNQNTQTNVNGAGIELGNNSTVIWQYSSTANAWLSNVGVSAAGSITTASGITATANITGGNILTAGSISATSNISTASGVYASGEANTGHQSATFGLKSGAFDYANTIVQVTANNPVNADLAIQNINSAGQTRITLFNDQGSSNSNFAVLGITGSDWADVPGRLTRPGDGFLVVVKDDSNNLTTGGNLVLGSYNGYTKIIHENTEIANLTPLGLSVAGNILASGLVSATGNILSNGSISATGNVQGSYILGNGSHLSGIDAFGTIKVQDQSDILANSINTALTFAAADGSGLIWSTDASNGVITLDQTAVVSIFSTGGSMGTIDQAVTSSQDLGLITDVYITSYDLGSVVASGLIYPSQLVLPTYTANTLPSASPAAQFIFLSASSLGAITAYSDGTNWRFTSTGAVVS